MGDFAWCVPNSLPKSVQQGNRKLGGRGPCSLLFYFLFRSTSPSQWFFALSVSDSQLPNSQQPQQCEHQLAAMLSPEVWVPAPSICWTVILSDEFSSESLRHQHSQTVPPSRNCVYQLWASPPNFSGTSDQAPQMSGSKLCSASPSRFGILWTPTLFFVLATLREVKASYYPCDIFLWNVAA